MKLLQKLNITTEWEANTLEDYREIYIYQSESEAEWAEFDECMDNMSPEDVLSEWFGFESQYDVYPGACFSRYSIRKIGYCAMITKVVRFNI